MPHFGEVSTLSGMDAGSFTPPASPYSYSASRNCAVVVSGGTVSQISYAKGGGALASSGTASGIFNMAAGDAIQITFTAAPAIKILYM